MDLGIAGRKAIVCAASKGLGKACALALAREGAELVINARTAADLEATAAEIRAAAGVGVTAVAGDITAASGRAAVLAACPAPDILVTNAGGPLPGDFRDWDEAAWQQALNDNMVTHILLVRAVLDGMIARRWGRIVNITSRSVKMPLLHLGLSNGSRAGLTGFLAGLARQVARHNVAINFLLPGPFATDRQTDTLRRLAAAAGADLDSFARAELDKLPAGRFGAPAEFGAACAFLCGEQAGFIVGHNLLIDGGSYPGLL